MLTFEKFRFRAFDRRAYYDVFNAGLLFVVAFLVLVSYWKAVGGIDADAGRLNTIAMMTSPFLLAAMGMMLAYRYGAIDLTVWAVMSVGGLLAAGILNAGLSPYLAFLVAIVAGVAIGWVNYIIIRFTHISSWIVTLVVAAAITVGLDLAYEPRRILITQQAFDELLRDVMWLLNVTPNDKDMLQPMTTMRMLVVFAGWAGVLIVLLIGDMLTAKLPRPFARWWVRPAALMTSGGLAGLAGACWLIERGSTPIPSMARPVDDLYIPAAVILSGTIFLTGRGRTLLVSICLPTAMLIVRLWDQITWPLSFYGYSIEMLSLVIMVGGIQWTFIWAMDYPIEQAWVAWTSLGVCSLALAMVALTPCLAEIISPREIYFIGSAVWCIGALATVISAIVVSRRRSKTDYD